MFAQINHMAMASTIYPFVGRFYEAVFGLKCSVHRPYHGVVYSDGYAGLNINPRRDGTNGGIDHFGFLVDDIDQVIVRLEKKWPGANIVKRPSTRPFAAYSGHDPDGNVFDLAQKKGDTRSNMYAEAAAESWNQDRYLNKFALRTLHVDQVADFYMDVFELQPTNKESELPAKHLSDGRVCLSLMPWSIDLFEGMAIKRQGPDHIGFKVESIEAVKAEVQKAQDWNQYLTPVQLGGSSEANTRRALLARAATGSYQLADPDGNWVDIEE
jgi:catechol 2,3-dioxygenase-like lactoylglutathione lyase family enzyme